MEAGDRFEAVAVLTVEPERSDLFDQMVRVNPSVVDYQRKTTRMIPVIVAS